MVMDFPAFTNDGQPRRPFYCYFTACSIKVFRGEEPDYGNGCPGAPGVDNENVAFVLSNWGICGFCGRASGVFFADAAAMGG